MSFSLLMLLAIGVPRFVVDPRLSPLAAVEREAVAAWEELAALYTAGAGVEVPPLRGAISLRLATHLARDHAGESQLGRIELRQTQPGVVDRAMLIALRHELAHQLLWIACPAAAADRLFHEAFALAISGELSVWEASSYLSVTAARRRLEGSRTLDSRDDRRALARLLAETRVSPLELPRPLMPRLRACGDRSPWRPMSPEELLAGIVSAGVDAFVVVSRHSGEVLWQRGQIGTPLPFGSTLKPFLLAGSSDPAPLLRPDPNRSEWSCTHKLPARMDGITALLLSCNGYFLDWVARAPGLEQFGPYGPVLQRLGLSRLPADGPEAIGLKPTLALSPLALAQAYRLLTAARPEIFAALEENVRRGTLAGLPASSELAGWATKTGTVRDAELRPQLGWIVAVNPDVVAVRARAGRMPRSFAGELAIELAPFRSSRALGRVEVQVFGLAAAIPVRARCEGVAVSLIGGPQLWPPAPGDGFVPLRGQLGAGTALCLGGAWRVRFERDSGRGRAYAGSFELSPPPAGPAPPAPTARAARARRGSDFLFRTHLGAYAAGVLESEDAAITGEPRAALLGAIAHNAADTDHHGGRPLCDTTHCQVFQGTRTLLPEDLRVLSRPDPLAPGWAPFSRGGAEPWREVRSARDLEAIAGAPVLALRFARASFVAVVRRIESGATWEEEVRGACESLRGPLRLLSCPDVARVEGARVVFEGHGQGHGMGLDVEAAKRSAEGREALLRHLGSAR